MLNNFLQVSLLDLLNETLSIFLRPTVLSKLAVRNYIDLITRLLIKVQNYSKSVLIWTLELQGGLQII